MGGDTGTWGLEDLGIGDWGTRDLRTKTYIKGHGMGLGTGGLNTINERKT